MNLQTALLSITGFTANPGMDRRYYWLVLDRWCYQTLNWQTALLSIAGFAVLVLFTGVLVLQFLAMIVHRVATLTHYLGRAPYSVRSSYNTVWTFDGTSPLKDIQSDDFQAMYAKQQAERRARLRLQPQQKRANQDDDERTRLI